MIVILASILYICILSFIIITIFWKYTGWLVTGGTSGKGAILREKRSRKYRIKIFRLRLCFRENRLWIFARYATHNLRFLHWSNMAPRHKVHAYRAKIQSRFSLKQSVKRKIFILHFRVLFSRRITPFPLVPPVTSHPVYLLKYCLLYKPGLHQT